MFFIEVHDEEFQNWLNSIELRIQTMRQTLLDIAEMIELNTQKFVPYDYNKPWSDNHLETSFRAVPTGNPREGFIEVEIGYSSIDPRDGYDYADYGDHKAESGEVERPQLLVGMVVYKGKTEVAGFMFSVVFAHICKFN